MPNIHLPQHLPATAEQAKSILDFLFSNGSVTRLTRGLESGYPKGEHLSAGLTRVPFVIICLEGIVDIGFLRGECLCKEPLAPFEAVFVKSNTWIHCDHSRAPLYFRVTLDTDHTLFGWEKKTDYQPLTRESTEKLELFASPHCPLQHTRALIQRLESASLEDKTPWALHALNLILTDLYHLLLLPDPIASGKGQRSWHAIRNYLQEHCGLSLNRKNVAESFRISPNHISRLFAEYSKTGFNDTLEQLRMDKATVLLRSSPLTVSEIAYRCGYAGANYFIRSFKKNYDMTPGKYREAITTSVTPLAFLR